MVSTRSMPARQSIRLLLSLPFLVIPPLESRAKVIAYPSPGNVEESPHYQVDVLQDGEVSSCFAYLTKAQWRTNLSEDTSYTSFSFDGEVSIRVINHAAFFKETKVLPSSRGIEVERSSNWITFTIDTPGKYAIEFDGKTKHPLLIFADSHEKDIPSPDDPDILYYGPGVHFLGIPGLILKPNQDVYLAPGAFVKGRIYGDDTPGARIYGRGVLSGQHLPGQPAGEYSVPHMIHFTDKSPGVTIEGITIVGSPHYNIAAYGADITVRDVKMMGWWFGTDGIAVGPNSLIEDCFLKVNDDAIKVYSPGLVARRCVFWQMENGAVFQLSWNLKTDRSGFHVYDCDVIRVEHRQEANNRGIFASIHGGAGNLSDYVFEDIRIENAHWRLLSLMSQKTKWAKSETVGNISDILFRNISVDGNFHQPSRIQSSVEESNIDRIRFENLTINGQLIESVEELNIDYDPTRTKNISFN